MGSKTKGLFLRNLSKRQVLGCVANNSAALTFKRRWFAEAEKKAELAVRLFPEHTLAYMNLAKARLELDAEVERVANPLLRAIQLHPTAQRYREVAGYFVRMKEYVQAGEHFRRSLELEENGNARHGWALCRKPETSPVLGA